MFILEKDKYERTARRAIPMVNNKNFLEINF